MKHKSILVLFAVGAIIVIGGALMKVMEYDYAKPVLMAGLFLEGLSGVLLWLKIRNGNDDSKGFFDQ
jgi:hypothetical protein